MSMYTILIDIIIGISLCPFLEALEVTLGVDCNRSLERVLTITLNIQSRLQCVYHVFDRSLHRHQHRAAANGKQ